jgi:hypothetical protein
MRIICNGENADEYALAMKLSEIFLKGIPVDIVPRRDAFALTIWSIDDIPINERTRGMSEEDKFKFMQYASKQLHSDMVERGHDSINTLLDLYLAEQGQSDNEGAAQDKWAEIISREAALYQKHHGKIPEANEELNELQREKTAAIYGRHNRTYIGQINFTGLARENLDAGSIYTEYTGQLVRNFGAAFVVPNEDKELAELIVGWNACEPPLPLELLTKITDRVEAIGGVNLIWS